MICCAFLRFPDKAAFLLATLPFRTMDGSLDILNLDIIGEIQTGGEWDEAGEVITEPTLLPGYHANILNCPDALKEFIIEAPIHPYRVFAGVPNFSAPESIKE